MILNIEPCLDVNRRCGWGAAGAARGAQLAPGAGSLSWFDYSLYTGMDNAFIKTTRELRPEPHVRFIKPANKALILDLP